MASSFPYLAVAAKHDLPYGLILAVVEWHDNPRASPHAIDDPRWRLFMYQDWGNSHWAVDAEHAWKAETDRRMDNDWIFQFTDDRGRIVRIWACGKVTGANVHTVINRIPRAVAAMFLKAARESS